AVIFDQRPDWVEHFADYPIAMTFFVPELLGNLGTKRDLQSANNPGLQVVVGGGFVDAGLAAKVAQEINCDVVVTYGATEFTHCLEQRVEAQEDAIWLTRVDGKVIEVLDEDDMPVPTGVEGIVRVKLGSFETDEYMDDPEATAKHFRDGYFYPGDMAVQREDGRIRILGRVADVLNLGGRKIVVRPFEERASKALQVETLCAFSQQDDDGKEMLIIVIEGDKLPDRARLQAVAKQIPQVAQIRFALINRFPRGDNGMMKVNRREVLRLVREKQSDQVNRPASVAT
ncbi:MAG: acyl--CoA ligase, partial [Sphingomonadaceae bacterium]|nr:acyl--CoA ligase [Sphingomonadaceae bacterium]